MPHWLTLLAIILPFSTGILIFTRQYYKEEALNLLMLLSILLFAKYLFTGFFTTTESIAPFYFSLFDTGELLLLLLLFRIPFRKTMAGQWINYLLVAFFSVIITLYSTQNNNSLLNTIRVIEAVILVLFCLFTLLRLIRNQYIFIFHSPLFWIAGGTLFYYSMLLAIELLSYSIWFQKIGTNEKWLLLSSFGVVRLLFYLVAALIKQSKKQEEDWDHFKNASPESHRE